MPSRSPCEQVPLVTVRCDLCGEGNDRTLLSLTDSLMRTTNQVFRLAQCRSCGLIYLNPRPPSDRMHRFYPATYAPFGRKGLSATARNWLYRRSVAELAGHLSYPRRVVDVGCGTGDLLRAVRAAGNINVLGIEPSSQAATIGRERYGLPIQTGTLERARLGSESVDTVLMSHVIEHLPSPRETMSEAARILKPGGAVVVWTPNARSLAARFLGQHWMGWDVPRHLYAFTPGTLHRLFDAAGLIPGEISHERHGLEWAWGLRLWASERFPNSPASKILRSIHPLLAAGLTPIGIAASTLGQSGRIRMIARKSLS